MALDESMLAALEAIYQAVTDEGKWPEVLQKIAVATNSQAANLWVVDRARPSDHSVFTFVNFDPAGVAEYLGQMVSMDPHVQYVIAHPELRIVHDNLYLTEREIDRHPYYDWQSRYSDVRYRILGQTGLSSTMNAGITLHRSPGSGRYDPNAIERFSVLYNHLEKAFLMAGRLELLGAMHQWSTDVLDQSQMGLLLFDQHGHIIYVNKQAEWIGGQGDGVRLSRDGLRLARLDDDKRLQFLLAQARGMGPSGASVGGMIKVPRASGKQPYVLSVLPVAARPTPLSPRWPAVAITIKDPGVRTLFPAQFLQTVFGLTPAEAELAHALVEGFTLRETAEKLCIQYGTARARLNCIFQKTQTRRQSELIKLILQTLPLN